MCHVALHNLHRRATFRTNNHLLCHACTFVYFTASHVCRAACAVMGFVGTWVGSALIASIGVLRTGVAALVLQAGSLAVAALIYRLVVNLQSLSCRAFLTNTLVRASAPWIKRNHTLSVDSLVMNENQWQEPYMKWSRVVCLTCDGQTCIYLVMRLNGILCHSSPVM